eukprot:Nitzschia sp. Nitz4//scaffold40_size135432//64331//67198//NITZ4_003244-RA/size135432-processed-gene-0.20-mRNA-1//1//CDS//3329551219//6248//frame0
MSTNGDGGGSGVVSESESPQKKKQYSDQAKDTAGAIAQASSQAVDATQRAGAPSCAHAASTPSHSQQQSSSQQQPRIPIHHPQHPQPPFPVTAHPPQFPTSDRPVMDGPQILHFYETQMRDHAAAYASAAWAAAQIAADMSNASLATTPTPHPPQPPHPPAQWLPLLPVPPAYPPMPSPYAAINNYSNYNPPYPPNYMDWTQQQQPHPRLQGSPVFDQGNPGDPSQNPSEPRRRKRHQQMPTSETTSSFPVNQDRRRRKFREGSNVSQDHSSPEKSQRSSQQSPFQLNNNGNNNPRRQARVRKAMASSNSSDGGSSSAASYTKKKKARQPNDDGLLGKTGVSALYEWCGKRRTIPTFTLMPPESNYVVTSSPDSRREFEIAVSIDGMERGRGRGRTKSAAKQEAARRALQALLPGVIFEPVSGMLVQLPGRAMNRSRGAYSSSWKASASMEDLAPNLAKRLAIRQNDDEDSPNANDASKKRPSKWQVMYPGTTTTTSEEEDGDTYYASRGASVCSALLHAMVQIDERIPEAPTYAYELATVSPSMIHSDTNISEKGSSPQPQVLIHRGPFTCTASMRLMHTLEAEELSDSATHTVLQAVGVAGTKRESRHTASAKLLALLFPECDGMMQVKQAAEAARERYAASKALKQQTKREQAFMSKNRHSSYAGENTPDLGFAMPTSNQPELPSTIEGHLVEALSRGVEPKEALQCSRQEQQDRRIALALQKWNEHDEEGRTLPEELTVDDVGRTVLRRAGPDDVHWVGRLLGASTRLESVSHEDLESYGDASNSFPDHLWSSSIVLLLCRAIAPFEDPPLGCAVMTMGFSMNQGRTLRLAQMGSEPHLPRERFIECLESFAGCMQAILELEGKCSRVLVRPWKVILASHLPSWDGGDWAAKTQSTPRRDADESRSSLASPLQSVQEASEEADDSSINAPETDRRTKKKGQDKPSKRSRVQ